MGWPIGVRLLGSRTGCQASVAQTADQPFRNTAGARVGCRIWAETLHSRTGCNKRAGGKTTSERPIASSSEGLLQNVALGMPMELVVPIADAFRSSENSSWAPIALGAYCTRQECCDVV